MKKLLRLLAVAAMTLGVIGATAAPASASYGLLGLTGCDQSQIGPGTRVCVDTSTSEGPLLYVISSGDTVVAITSVSVSQFMTSDDWYSSTPHSGIDANSIYATGRQYDVAFTPYWGTVRLCLSGPSCLGSGANQLVQAPAWGPGITASNTGINTVAQVYS